MKRQDRDELLSTYLDGELGGAEQARLEAQLAEDPALQSELDTLRRTVEMVRNLPVQPVPRNFILPQSATTRSRPTPAVRPHRRWTAPLLTAATSVVSLLFVAILAGDLLLSGSGYMPMSNEADEQKLAAPEEVVVGVEVVEEAEKQAPPDSAESPLPITADDTGDTPLPEAPAATAPTAEPAGTSLPSPTPPGAWKEQPADDENGSGAEGQDRTQTTEPPAAAVGGGGEGSSTPTPAPPATSAATPPPPPLPPTPTDIPETRAVEAGGTEPTDGPSIPPTPGGEKGAVGGEAEAPGPMPEEEYADPELILTWLSPWRILTVALGVTALGLAVATVLAWRARRR